MLRVEKQGTRLVPLGCLDLEPISLPRSDEFRQYIANSWQEFFAEVGHNLFLNGTAVGASDNGLESVDLLAVDKDGRTVVVSLHRDDEPSQLTRSLVCASLVASWDPPQILEYLFQCIGSGKEESSRGQNAESGHAVGSEPIPGGFHARTLLHRTRCP